MPEKKCSYKMEIIYDRLKTSVSHLEKIEKVLTKDKSYKKERKKFDKDTSKLIPELFYSKEIFKNQMALADVIEYIFLGRAYHIMKNEKSFDNFYKLLIRACNLFFLQDSLVSNSHKYRKTLLDELEKVDKITIPKSDRSRILNFKDSLAPQVNKYSESKEETRKEVYSMIDGLMPKILGMPNELITYVHLIRKRLGFVVPLLLNQKLFKGKIDNYEEKETYPQPYSELLSTPIHNVLESLVEYCFDIDLLIEKEINGKNRKTLIKQLIRKQHRHNVSWCSPPDFLLITRNKRVFGIEVGGAKERQQNEFATLTGIPILTIFSDVDCSYRCPKCKEWILFSDFVIKHGMKLKYSKLNSVSFDEMEQEYRNYDQAVCYTKISSIIDKKRHYHYRCVKSTTGELPDNELFYYFPFVNGLETLEKEHNS